MFTLMLAFASSAHAVGGTFAGPALEDLPQSSATQIAIALQGKVATLTVSAQAGQDMEGIAYLWPAPGFVQGSQALVEVDGLTQIEAFTRPRVEALECEELVDTRRYRTPPGCASYEVQLVEPPARGEDAVADVSVDTDFSTGELQLSIVAATDVESWLADRKLWLPQTVLDGLADLRATGAPVVAAYHPGFLARGDWLPPVRFAVQRGQITLPLGAYAAEAEAPHDVSIYTLHDDLDADATITNLEEGSVLADCQIPDGQTPTEWFDAEVNRFAPLPDPPWVSAWRGPAASCAPCTGELLEPLVTADLGVPGADLADYRVNRLFLRLAPAQLDTNPVVAFSATAHDGGLRWLEPRAGIGFLFPECGADPEPLDVCAQVQTEDTRGCTAIPLGWMAGSWALLVLGVSRRRRVALGALLLGALVAAPPALAGGDDGWKEQRPVWEVQVATGLLGTPRVRLERSAQAGPRVATPMLGLQGRRVVRHLRDGMNLGVTAGLRGFSGPLQIGNGADVRFTFMEPSVGVDVRHGIVRPNGIGPFVRYGARLAVPILDPDASKPQAQFTGMLQVGGGVLIGNDARDRRWWPIVELRGTLIPRTDGFVTEYHPALDLPWYTFYPGGANLELLVGIGFE